VDWELYAAHRARLTDVILGAAGSEGGRLCLLGAGACNDFDLARAAERFSEIHLVDLDAKAVARAVARPDANVRARLHKHAPVDLSGLSARRLARWRSAPPDAAELEEVSAGTLDALCDRLPGPFDVVASTCVLTQMAFALREALGERHPALDAIRFALMRAHLSSLVALTAEGGTAVFATDLVSSTSYPLDGLPPERPLRDVMQQVVASGAGYYAANPDLVTGILAHAGKPELLDPWLWTGPLGRTYLVYALLLHVPFES
jgi:hypothetical protein